MSQGKRALGKGLGALLQNSAASRQEDASSATEIDLSRIEPNPFQPRRVFSRESIEELAQSIAENELLQPITLRKTETGYQIVHGERRFRAFEFLGREQIPAIIKDLDDRTMLVHAVLENIQREDLNPIDEAISYQRLALEFQLTHEELAQNLGKSRSHITNSLRLLKLPPSVLEYVQSGMLSPGGARALLTLADEDRIRKTASEVIVQGLNVRQIEQYVKQLQAAPQSKSPHGPNRTSVSDDMRSSLSSHFAQIPWNVKSSGKKLRLELDFQNEEELADFLSRFQK